MSRPLNVTEVRFYAAIMEACQRSVTLDVQVKGMNDCITGEARHVVCRDHEGFVHGPDEPSLQHRLRVTATKGVGEFFIPLHDIEGVSIHWVEAGAGLGDQQYQYLDGPARTGR
jgi:hypothetical protein